MKAISRRAEAREEELSMLIETLENKHGKLTITFYIEPMAN